MTQLYLYRRNRAIKQFHFYQFIFANVFFSNVPSFR